MGPPTSCSLNDVRLKGVLTDAEFETATARVLDP